MKRRGGTGKVTTMEAGVLTKFTIYREHTINHQEVLQCEFSEANFV